MNSAHNRVFTCLFAVAALFTGHSASSLANDSQRKLPNILWVTSEDNGPQLGCYGDLYADSPNIDALAAKGVIYANCWSNAPVCAPARTTIISGLYPTSLGGQHMRSQVRLPSEATLYPGYLKQLGYYCTNNSKEDYNLFTDADLWDESSKKAHWRNRAPNQPFFAIFNFTISHESKLRTRPHEAIHPADQVFVPPYHPDTPEVRQDWAQYYDRITEMDRQVGEVLQQLKDDELEQDTIVFYYGDHGSGMPRGKRWLYQSGLHVPLIVHVPDQWKSIVPDQYAAGTTNPRLVSFVDLMPTVLSLAGMEPPSYLHGKAFLGAHATPDPEYIFGFRDRMDERYDMARAVRDQRYMYIRNFYPQRPQGAYLDYMFKTPTTRVWFDRFQAGELTEAQSFFWQPKPSEELYDLHDDPYQVRNLADQPEHAATLVRLRKAVVDWMVDVRDVGLMPEGEMLARAGNDSPYDVGHASDYPVAEYVAIADLATREQPDDLQKLQSHQDSPDSTIRFWVASGMLHRAMNGNNKETIRIASSLSTDDSPYVRCLANETLARFGSPQQRADAISALLEMADARSTNTFVAMTAMNCLDWCEPSRAELTDKLQGIPAKEAELSKRYGSYIPNLVKRLESIAN